VTTRSVFSQDGIILNACCVRNIYASGVAASILTALPIPAMIAAIVVEHVPLRIFQPGHAQEKVVHRPIDLQPLLDAGALTLASLSSEEEEIAMLFLAAKLGTDGLAATAALARQRKWAIGVDGPAAIGLIRQHLPDLQIVSSSLLIQYWIGQSQPPNQVLRAALWNMHQGARYVPPDHDPQSHWWKEILESQANKMK
jgi:hypothetical protein